MADKQNMSSGAEKVEKLAAEKNNGKKKCSGGCKGANKGGKCSSPAKKPSAEKAQSAKSEQKGGRFENWLEHRRRSAELRARQRREKRERAAEVRKARLAEKKAERDAKLAEKKAKREHDLKVRAQKRAEREDKRHAPGIGGWLAAVISLGVTSLALATIVTFGWMTMDNMQMNMAGYSTQSLYELNSIIDNLDADLTRVRATTSDGDRVRTLTEIVAESETAETVLERMPVQMQSTRQLASFLNKMSDSAKGMIYDIARGGELSPSQVATLAYMYETNREIKTMLNELVSNSDMNDMLDALRNKDGVLGDSFTTLENNTFETPKSIQDGPFADSVKKTNPRALEGLEEITPQTAEELAMRYFADYNPTEAHCTGEAVGSALTAYNVCLATPDGEMLAQISKLGGKVIMFDSYKECSAHNFDTDRCIMIAQDFLESIGYEGLVAVWTSENGSTCNLNFAPVDGGAIIYPDLVKVKVCEERGVVTGIEALNYVLNHGERQLTGAAIGVSRAREGLSGDMTVEGERLALIPLDGEEVLCYEFFGTLGDNEYYVYVDAVTGEEVEVLTVIGTAQGKALM